MIIFLVGKIPLVYLIKVTLIVKIHCCHVKLGSFLRCQTSSYNLYRQKKSVGTTCEKQCIHHKLYIISPESDVRDQLLFSLQASRTIT